MTSKQIGIGIALSPVAIVSVFVMLSACAPSAEYVRQTDGHALTAEDARKAGNFCAKRQPFRSCVMACNSAFTDQLPLREVCTDAALSMTLGIAIAE